MVSSEYAIAERRMMAGVLTQSDAKVRSVSGGSIKEDIRSTYQVLTFRLRPSLPPSIHPSIIIDF